MQPFAPAVPVGKVSKFRRFQMIANRPRQSRSKRLLAGCFISLEHQRNGALNSRQPVQTQTADFSKLSDEELAQLDRIFCELSEPQTLPE